MPAGDFQPTLVSDLVHDRLLASIVAGELKPGDRLRLDQIAKRYGVSRTPVREAVTRLARNNFVLVSRYTSSVVAPWGARGTRERLTAIIAMAEAGAAHLSSDDIRTLRKAFADIAIPDERTAVDLIAAVIAKAYPLLGEQLRDDLIAPVRLYFDGSNTTETASPLLGAWGPFAVALRADDRDGLVLSIGVVFAALVKILDVPGADLTNA